MKRIISTILTVVMLLSAAAVTGIPAAANDAVLIDYGSKWEYVCYEEDASVGLTHQAPEGWLTGTDAAVWKKTRTPVCAAAWASTQYKFPYANYSAFLRKNFVIEKIDSVTSLTMYIKYDENPVVYINGEQVWSATGYVDSRYVEVSLSDKTGLLHEGKNTVQVAISNVNGGGIFDMALINTGAMESWIDRGSDAWEYLEYERTDNDHPAQAPAGWNTGEDHSGNWLSGTAPFAAHAWNAADAANTWFSYNAFDAYLRTTVTLEDASKIQSLFMDIFYDENPVLYVNGEQVWSASGYSTSYVTVQFTSEMLSKFKDGENVIAAYFCNAKDTGYGSKFDLSLYGSIDTSSFYDEDGKILIRNASCEGIGSFGSINDPSNVLDEEESTVCGSGWQTGSEMSVTVSFAKKETIESVFVQCKNEGTTTNADGTRGTYKLYAVNGEEQIYLGSIPAVTGTDGGCVLTLEEPVKAGAVKVVIDSWQGDCWACVADVVVTPAVYVYDHVYGPWTVNTAPTCVSEGNRTRVCEDCAQTQTEAIPATGVHSYAEEVTASATFTQEGSKHCVCTVCGNETEEAIAPATLSVYPEAISDIREGAPCVSLAGLLHCEAFDPACAEKISVRLIFRQNGDAVNEKTVTLHGLYKTVTGVLSTDETTAAAQNVACADASYVFAVMLTGVPAGDYTVDVQIDALAQGASLASASATIGFTV